MWLYLHCTRVVEDEEEDSVDEEEKGPE